MLTSVIVNENRQFPAIGYSVLVERLDGLPNDITEWSEPEKEDWWQGELADVHDRWNGYDG